MRMSNKDGNGVDDFWPITLLTGDLKLLTRILRKVQIVEDKLAL